MGIINKIDPIITSDGYHITMPSLATTIAVDRMKLDVEGHLLFCWRQYNNIHLPMNAVSLDEMVWAYVETIGVDKHYNNGEQVKITREKYTLNLNLLDEVAMIGDLFEYNDNN